MSMDLKFTFRLMTGCREGEHFAILEAADKTGKVITREVWCANEETQGLIANTIMAVILDVMEAAARTNERNEE